MKFTIMLLSLFKVLLLTQAALCDVRQHTLSGEALLYKISQATRSANPSSIELMRYREAAKQGEGEAQQVLQELTREFISSEQHARKLRFKLEELFHYRAETGNKAYSPNFLSENLHFKFGLLYRGVSQNLFEDLSLKNMSWDQLLTANSYRLPFESCEESGDEGVVQNDCNFFSFLKPVLKTYPNYAEMSFPGQEEKLAGSITTGRFFSRYGNTALNKNRGRASAVFRIFLCDTMFAAVPEPSADVAPLVDLIYPEVHEPGRHTEEHIRASKANDRHGSDSSCAKCHDKLDPLGRVFQTSARYLAPISSPGRLTYKNSRQQMTDIPVQNFSELAKAIVQQPEYRTCQVKRLWQWYIGKDISISEADQAEVERKFDEMGRRTNDFVAYLISRPEFKIRMVRTPEIQVAERALGILQRCDSCHRGKESNFNGPIPSFSELPIGGSRESMALWIRLIGEQLDLDHDGVNRTMPPSSGFSLSASDIRSIKMWFSLGNPDLAGRRMSK